MKMGKRKAVVLLLALCILLMQCAVCASDVSSAASTIQNSNMDVVLVIDVSGSMKNTDRKKVALDGAKLFVDMMESSGSRAGVVAFSDQIVLDNSLTPVNSDADKQAIRNAIDGLRSNSAAYSDGDTDIGAALKRAIEMQTTAQDIGNKKMILFFTDGKIDLPKGRPSQAEAEAVSRQLAAEATSTAAASSIPIYTIGLNADGNVDTELISNIAANTGATNNVVADASSLPDIYNTIFADFVESEIEPLGNITITDSEKYEELPFTIPNDSVLEANIVMITSMPDDNTGTASQLSDIRLVRPDGNTVGPDGQSVLLSASNNYNMLKLIGPQAGNWTLQIKGSQGCQVHVNLLFNYDVILRAEGQADADGNFAVRAFLEKNGVPVADSTLYAQMATTANVSRSDGTVTSYPMTFDGTAFTGTIPVNSGEQISVTVHTEGANMYRDSDPLTYQNAAPVEVTPPIVAQQPLPSPIKVKGFLRSMAKTTLDLGNYFSTSDPTNQITGYNVQAADPGLVEFEQNGSELTIKGLAKGSTSVTVQAADSQGNLLSQDTVAEVSYTLGSILPLLLIPLALILLVVIIIIVIKCRPVHMRGYLYWHIQSDEFSANTEEEQYDLTFAKTKATVSSFITELSLAYAGLDKVEIKAGKNESLVVTNNGKTCTLVDEYGAESKKLSVFDGGSFRIMCKTEDGEDIFVVVRYQRDLNEFEY